MKTVYHKYLGCIVALMACVQLSQAQSFNQNYVLSKTMVNATSTTSRDKIEYYDGLGRPVETVLKAFSPSGHDLVNFTEYNAMGNIEREWLPANYASNSGQYIPVATIKSETPKKHGNDTRPFNEYVREASPLNRVIEAYGPGAVWANPNYRNVATTELGNASSGELSCGYYYISDDNLGRSNNYAANTLYVVRTMDENRNISYVFKDKLERVVLQRQISEGLMHDTYYVYDDMGNLRYVLPPLAADATTAGIYYPTTKVIMDYAYLYKYDYRNRCTWKKLPGAEAVNMVYDKSDRMVLSQDGEQKKAGKYTFYKYDKMGRLILSGERADNRSPETLRPLFKDALIVETYDYTGLFNYTNNDPLKLTDSEVNLANYYDDYDFRNQFPASNYLKSVAMEAYGWAKVHASAKGLQTGSMVKLLDGSNTKIATAWYYDARGQVAQTRTNNHLGGMDYTYYSYNFDGTINAKQIEHGTRLSKTDVTEKYSYLYDSQGRLQTTKYKLNQETEKNITSYAYNELGQVKSKTTAGLENTAYTYNIRGWMKSIEGTRFSQTLYYTETPKNNGEIFFDGSISAYTWKAMDKPSLVRGWNYHYDGLGRMRNATYGEGTSLAQNDAAYAENFNLDKHGNVMQIVRSGRLGDKAFGTIDIATTLVKDGNKIMQVFDYGDDQPYSDLMEVKARWQRTNEYDANGRQTKDGNKIISKIEYNYLNLPKRIQDELGNSINYAYDAAGGKRKVDHYVSGSPEQKNNYVDNKIYENGVIKMILNEEGYAANENGTYKYYYYLKDHLGNNRVVMDAAGNALQVTNYYPFGMSMAETLPRAEDQHRQPFKFNGKELDRSMGLDLYDYHARQYDPIMGRFMTMDPMAEKYYSISPYAYCGNNPVKYVDPDGMDIYLMGQDGRTTLALKNDDKFDQLYSTTKDKGGNTLVTGNSIKVNDRELLPQLLVGDNFTHAETSNSTDAFNVFKFAADNTTVEWSMAGFNNNGSTDYLLNSSFNKSSVLDIRPGREQSDMIFHVHSHPGTEDYTKRASGYDLYNNGISDGGSDANFMSSYFNAAKSANKKWPSEYPSLFFYHKESKGLYNYNHQSDSKFVGKVSSPAILKTLVSDPRIK